MKVERVALFIHPQKPEAKSVAEEVEKLASARGLSIEQATEASRADLIVAIGGDGTILRAARLAHGLERPLLGINVGRLGFLSAADPTGLAETLDAVVSGSFLLESRMMIEAVSEPRRKTAFALNDIVVERSRPTKVIRIRALVDTEEVATYTADGFIVSTPTGSTAYSLSAGGPVLEPNLNAIVLTPVSAHSPLWRSIVLAPERTVILEVVGGNAALSADGDLVDEVTTGERVSVRKHERPLTLVRLDQLTRAEATSSRLFFRKLRSRFDIELG